MLNLTVERIRPVVLIVLNLRVVQGLANEPKFRSAASPTVYQHEACQLFWAALLLSIDGSVLDGLVR